MKLNRIVVLSFALVFSCFTTSCDRQFQQTVSFKFVNSAGDPRQGIAFWYFAEGSCKGQFKSAVSSGKGEASISRVAIRGGVGVLLEEPSLCIEHEGKWLVAWQEFIDPADDEKFLCKASSAGKFTCERLDPGNHT